MQPFASKRRSPPVENFHRIFAGLRVERVEPAVVAAHVDDAVHDGGVADSGSVRLVLPQLPAVGRIDRVDVAVIAAEVERASWYTGDDTMRSPVGNVHLTRRNCRGPSAG